MSRTCLVTGGARGIGREACRLLAADGWDVAVGYRERQEDAQEVVAAVEAEGRRGIAVQGDVAVEADIVRMMEETDQQLGRLRGLVNSAGVSHHGVAGELDMAGLERLMAVNVVGLMLCCREAVRRMSTERGGQGGAIVNVSSMAATIGGRPGAAAYAASKGAVDVFTTGISKEVAGQGIRVNVVRPGVTLTDMVDVLRADPAKRAAVEATIPMGRVGAASEVAEAIVWLLSDKASFVTGAHVNVGGGGFLVGAGVR